MKILLLLAPFLQSTIAISATGSSIGQHHYRRVLKSGSDKNGGGRKVAGSATKGQKLTSTVSPSPSTFSISAASITSAPSISVAGNVSSSPMVSGKQSKQKEGGGKKGLSDYLSSSPSMTPITAPSFDATNAGVVTPEPSAAPTLTKTNAPSSLPTLTKTNAPSSLPTLVASPIPSFVPTDAPSTIPSFNPSNMASFFLSSGPSVLPSMVPSLRKTFVPSTIPTIGLFAEPSEHPTSPPSETVSGGQFDNGDTDSNTTVDTNSEEDENETTLPPDAAQPDDNNNESSSPSGITDDAETATIVLGAIGGVCCFMAGLIIARQRGWHESDVVRRLRDMNIKMMSKHQDPPNKNNIGSDNAIALRHYHKSNDDDHLASALQIVTHHASWDAEAVAAAPPEQPKTIMDSNSNSCKLGIIGLKDIAEETEDDIDEDDEDDDDDDDDDLSSAYSDSIVIHESFSGGCFDESSPTNQEGFERIWNEEDHASISFNEELLLDRIVNEVAVASGERTTESRDYDYTDNETVRMSNVHVVAASGVV
mmetsp:Transcript_33993/g.49258  ORF Transcript_33993/g.49258 Transcript_33993/m.49258 type:complete len:536 (-) Transcript_33993:191-1798(-)